MIRLAVGAMLCVLAVAITVYGFIRLTGVLEHGGYGTPAVRNALIILGVAGALLATGVATVIWDISKRYEKPQR